MYLCVVDKVIGWVRSKKHIREHAQMQESVCGNRMGFSDWQDTRLYQVTPILRQFLFGIIELKVASQSMTDCQSNEKEVKATSICVSEDKRCEIHIPLIPHQTKGKQGNGWCIQSPFSHDAESMMDINTGITNNYICKAYLSQLILNKTETSMRSESKVRKEDKWFSKA